MSRWDVEGQLGFWLFEVTRREGYHQAWEAGHREAPVVATRHAMGYLYNLISSFLSVDSARGTTAWWMCGAACGILEPDLPVKTLAWYKPFSEYWRLSISSKTTYGVPWGRFLAQPR